MIYGYFMKKILLFKLPICVGKRTLRNMSVVEHYHYSLVCTVYIQRPNAATLDNYGAVRWTLGIRSPARLSDTNVTN